MFDSGKASSEYNPGNVSTRHETVGEDREATDMTNPDAITSRVPTTARVYPFGVMDPHASFGESSIDPNDPGIFQRRRPSYL